jgi:macrolide transport system ATP-binding/permease protein
MRMLESLLQDLAYAFRAMRRVPLVSAAAVISLALGIGANTAIFSLIDAVMLRSLPVRSPQELVQIGWIAKPWPQQFVSTTSGRGVMMFGQNVALPFSLDTYQRIRSESVTLAAVAGRMDLFSSAVVVVARGRADTAHGNLVSGNFFDTLGVAPAAGRLFADADDREGAEPVAALSYSYWTRRFAADPGVIGTAALINGTSYTIVGVTDRAFDGVVVGMAPEVYVPLHCHPLITAREGFDRNVLHTPWWWWVEIIGRRKPGIAEQQVRAELTTLFRQSLTPMGSEPVKPENYPRLVVGSPDDIQNGVRTQFSRPLVVLMTMVGFVLLIACANIANLLLARAVARKKEMAMRLALGARPRRLFRQMMVESVLLAATGGALGLAIAHWGTGVLVKLVSSETNPLTLDVRADGRVLLFLIAVSVTAGILFGVVPAIQSSRVDVNSLLKASSGERGRFRLGRALVILQVAVSLALLMGAGLYVRTLWNLRHTALGFNAENVLVFHLAPKRGGYNGDKLLRLIDRVSERIDAIPGVRSVAYSHVGLLNQLQTSGPVQVAGELLDRSKSVLILYVSPGFFEAMQIPVMAGRTVREGDGGNAPRVAVANEAMARQYFGQASPIGRQVLYFMDKYKAPMEIVGLVKDAKYTSVTAAIRPVLYLPYAQNLEGVQEAVFEVRTTGDPRAVSSAIRELVQRVDPELPVFDMTTETALRDQNLRDQRLLADLAAAFAVLALLLAALGLYGAISYSISRRTGEIGIRMALGANRGRVVAQVLGECFLVVGVGMTIGMGLALAGTRLIASQLYGLQPRDPATMAAAAGLIVVVTAAASFVPARRASRLDPMAALRQE